MTDTQKTDNDPFWQSILSLSNNDVNDSTNFSPQMQQQDGEVQEHLVEHQNERSSSSKLKGIVELKDEKNRKRAKRRISSKTNLPVGLKSLYTFHQDSSRMTKANLSGEDEKGASTEKHRKREKGSCFWLAGKSETRISKRNKTRMKFVSFGSCQVQQSKNGIHAITTEENPHDTVGNMFHDDREQRITTAAESVSKESSQIQQNESTDKHTAMEDDQTDRGVEEIVFDHEGKPLNMDFLICSDNDQSTHPKSFFFLHSVTSARCNLFYLLSRHGNFVEEHIWQPDVAQREWSSISRWYLVSVRNDGYPWRLRNFEDLSLVLANLAPLERLQEKEVDAKIEEIRKHYRDAKSYRQQEWKYYNERRKKTLQILGAKSLEQYLSMYPDNGNGTSGRRHQSLRWHNNSCAMDSMLFLVPHLYYRTIQKGFFPSEMYHGRNAAIASPGLSLLASVYHVRNLSQSCLLSSDWVRMHAVELSMETSQHQMKELRRWTCFQPSPFLDLTASLSAIDYFFRREPCSGCGELPVSFISSFVTSNVFKEMKRKSETEQKFSVAEFLYQCIIDQRKYDGRPSVYNKACNLIGIFIFSLGEAGISSWIAKNYSTTKWKDTFALNKDNSGCEKVEFETLGVIGPSKRDKEHFVAANYHYNPHLHFEYHDGLQDEGNTQLLEGKELFHPPAQLLDLDFCFIVGSSQRVKH